MTNPIDTAALRRAHKATTSGQWEAGDDDNVWCGSSSNIDNCVAVTFEYGDAEFIALAHEQWPALLDEIDELREWIIAFGGPWAVSYANQCGLPDGSMIASHYDILKRCGARMDDFTRVELTALGDPS